MDAKPRASKSSKGTECARPDSLQNSSVSNITTIRERSSISSRSSRIKSNVSYNDTDRLEVTPASTSSSNNIFDRVTNSVSGLFSNVSWSEWLKSPSTSVAEEGTGNSSYRRSDVSSVNSDSSSSFLGHKSDKSFHQLYPEEGTSDLNPLEEARPPHNTSEIFADKPLHSMHTAAEMSSFKRDLSIVSSTPTLSPRKKGAFPGGGEFLCDSSVISKPSTSLDFQRDLLVPEGNSLRLLQESLPEPPQQQQFHSNGSLAAFPSRRKRTRDISEDDDSIEDVGGKSAKRGKGVSAAHPTFTEQLDASAAASADPQARKRPRFSISTYGSPFYRNLSTTEDEPPSFSIFYPGKVMYGGASNHQRKKPRIIPRRVCPRTPASAAAHNDDTSDGGLSSAARRILNCIDKISTPLSDSKRIFPFTQSRNFSLDTSSYVADFHKHRPALKSNAERSAASPPVNNLLTPSKIKIHKNLSSLLEAKSVDVNSSKMTFSKNVSPSSAESRPSVSFGRDTSSIPSTSRQQFSTTHFSATNLKRNPIKSSLNRSVKSTVPDQQQQKQQQLSSVLNFPKPLEMEEKKGSVTDNLGFNNSPFAETRRGIGKKTENTNITSISQNIEKKLESFTKVVDEDDFQFSDPEIVSDFSAEVIGTVGESVFVFSSPLHEVESACSSKSSSSSSSKSNSSSCKSSSSSSPSSASSKPMENNLTAFNWGDKFKASKDVWDCDVCLLQNDASKSKCVACESPKPQGTTTIDSSKISFLPPSTGFSGWGTSKTSTVFGISETSVSLKKSDVTTSVFGFAPQPQTTAVGKSDISSVQKTFNQGFSTGSWGDAFKAPVGTGDCEMCVLQNKADASKCVACETPKPTTTQNKPSTAPPPTSMPVVANSWGNTFKPAKGSWDCSECLIQNDASTSNCVACKAAKPKDSAGGGTQKNKDAGSFSSPFGAFGGSSLREDSSKGEVEEGKTNLDNLNHSENNIWVCPKCITMNKAGDDKCVSCKNMKTTTNDSTKTNVKSFSSGSEFGPEFFKAKDEWECETCLVRNKGGDQKCVSCETPRFQLSRSTIVSEALTGNFKFGVNSQPLSAATAIPRLSFPSFSPPSTVTTPVAARHEFSNVKPVSTDPVVFAPSKPTIPPMEFKPVQKNCFGNTNAASTTTPTFSFFKPSSTEATKKNEISAAPSALTTAAAAPKPMLFQFGSSTTTTNTNKLETKLEFPKIGNKITTNMNNNNSDPPPPLIPKVSPAPFNFFGNTDAKKDAATPTALPPAPFLPPTNVSKDVSTPFAAPSLYVFGQPNTKPLSTGFNFGEAAPKNPVANFGSTPPLFQFGQPTQASQKTAEPVAPAFLNIETPQSNLFTAGGGVGAAASQRRIRKAYRRNK